MNVFKHFLVLSTSFCVFSNVHGGVLELAYEGQQHNIDLSSLTSALTGGLHKVLDIIRNPQPVTIEFYQQQQPYPSPYGGENPYYVQKYPPPDPHHHYYHHHHHHHGQRPPFPPGEGRPPPNYPFGEMDYNYPNVPNFGQQSYGQNQNYYPVDNRQDVDQQYGGMDGKDGNADTETGLIGNDDGDTGKTTELPLPVLVKHNEESVIHSYINDFPVILLNENDIR